MNEQDRFYAELEAELAKYPKPVKPPRRAREEDVKVKLEVTPRPGIKPPDSSTSPADVAMFRFREALAHIMTVPKEEVVRLVKSAKSKKDRLGERRYRKI